MSGPVPVRPSGTRDKIHKSGTEILGQLEPMCRCSYNVPNSLLQTHGGTVENPSEVDKVFLKGDEYTTYANYW